MSKQGAYHAAPRSHHWTFVARVAPVRGGFVHFWWHRHGTRCATAFWRRGPPEWSAREALSHRRRRQPPARGVASSRAGRRASSSSARTAGGVTSSHRTSSRATRRASPRCCRPRRRLERGRRAVDPRVSW